MKMRDPKTGRFLEEFKIKKLCKFCQIEFKSLPAANRKFCSPECYHEHRKDKSLPKCSITKLGFDIEKYKKQIINLYNSNYKITTIAKRFNVCPTTIRDHIKKWGIKLRHIGHYDKGQAPWNVGLTKETSTKILKLTQKVSETLKNKYPEGRPGSFKKGHFVPKEQRKRRSIKELGFDIEQFKDQIIGMYRKGYDAITIAREFNISTHPIYNRLKEWGEPIRKPIWGVKNFPFIAKDGHRLRSSPELEADNHLFDLGINHIPNKELNGTKMSCDQYLPDLDLHIEIWGLKGFSVYDKRMQKKLAYYKKHKLKLFEISYPDEGVKEKLNTLIPLIENCRQKTVGHFGG